MSPRQALGKQQRGIGRQAREAAERRREKHRKGNEKRPESETEMEEDAEINVTVHLAGLLRRDGRLRQQRRECFPLSIVSTFLLNSKARKECLVWLLGASCGRSAARIIMRLLR